MRLNVSSGCRLLNGVGVLLLFGCISVASGATLCVAPTPACHSTISAAVAAAAPGDIIDVAQGTYKEQVTITKALSLLAVDHQNTVIDASGQSNGIFINGLSAAPNAGVADVLISGFTVQNANFEGILVVNATDVTLLDNQVLNNDKSLVINAGTCTNQPILAPFETNEGDDCGEGIHLMAVDHSFVADNVVKNNSGGILISDETGPNHDNLIAGNIVQDNPYDCGITLASHPYPTSGVPLSSPPPNGSAYGVTDNTISHNISTHNGYLVPGAGAGVGIFAPGPGNIDSGNVVIDNVLTNNGLPGVTMHNHAFFPSPAPAVNMNNNKIIGNLISGNAADTEDAATSGPTGINVYSAAPVTGTVISRNIFDHETIDIAFNAPSGQINAHQNGFDGPGSVVGVETYGPGTNTSTVNATENWWNCPSGPGTPGCASVVGSGVTSTPWLFAPLPAFN
jgi:parallel beta-helix repeat protein